MKLITEILNILVTTILSLIIIIFIATKIFRIEPYVVMSGSMEPAIHTGSLVFVDTKDKDINVGDIIAFNKGDISVTHRVSGINEDGTYITKGDANESIDSAPIAREQIIGTILFTVPVMGFMVTYLRTPYGIAALVGLIAIYLVLTVYQNKHKKHKEKANEKTQY